MTDKKILIVHADKDVGLLLSTILGTQTDSISIATNVYEAENFLATYSYKAVLTDINIDGISRSQYLKKLQEKQPNDAIILLSEMDQQDILDEVTGMGLSKFLDFPVSIEELRQALDPYLS